MAGSVTRQNVCQSDAPRVRDASSCSVPISRSTGTTSRTTKGSETKIVAITIPGVEKITRMPCSGQPPAEPAVAPVDEDQRQADDDRGDGERQVDESAEERLPPHPAAGRSPAPSPTPKIVFAGTAMATITSVSQNACCASGVVTASQAGASPCSKVR
jgi:hypothetical protein